MQQFHIDKALSEDPRESKLPAWAREKLTDMRRATTESVAQLSALKAGTERGPFWLDPWDRIGRFYLPRSGGRLVFGDPDGKMSLDLSARIDSNDHWLDINSNGAGVIATPHASNVLRVRAMDW